MKVYKNILEGKYVTLTGAALIINIIVHAFTQHTSEINPDNVYVNFTNHKLSLMYPTPRTYLFDMLTIEDDKIIGFIGNWNKNIKFELNLADPNLHNNILNLIKKRIAKFKKLKI